MIISVWNLYAIKFHNGRTLEKSSIRNNTVDNFKVINKYVLSSCLQITDPINTDWMEKYIFSAQYNKISHRSDMAIINGLRLRLKHLYKWNAEYEFWHLILFMVKLKFWIDFYIQRVVGSQLNVKPIPHLHPHQRSERKLCQPTALYHVA